MVLKPSLGNSEQPSCFCSWRSIQTFPKDFTRDIIFLSLSICQRKVGWEHPHPALQHPPPTPPTPTPRPQGPSHLGDDR